MKQRTRRLTLFASFTGKERRIRLRPVFLPMIMGSDDDGGRNMKSSSTCEWTPNAVFCLLERYGEKYALGRGYLRNRDWEEVVGSVNSHCDGINRPKTLKQCRDKVDSLKKRYKMEKRRIVSVGATSSSWPFFAKLDEIMESVPKTSKALGYPRKQARIVSNNDVGRSVSPVEHERPESSNEKDEESPSTGDSPTDSASRDYGQGDSSERKGKTALEDSDDLSEDESDTRSTSQKRIPDTKGSGDDSTCLKKIKQLSERMIRLLAKKKRQMSSHPVQALADAIVGFSDVYSRIELAKIEIYMDMQFEIANLERNQKSTKRKSATSSSSDSELR